MTGDAGDGQQEPTFEQMMAALYQVKEDLEGESHEMRHDVVSAFATDPMQFDAVLLLTLDLHDGGGAASLRCSMKATHPGAASSFAVIAAKLRETAAALDARQPKDRGACVLFDSSKPDKGPAQA